MRRPVNNPLNKDDILNAYAALFKNTASGHVILYAGVERDSNNGNSFVGFWIFKGNVGCNAPGNFSSQHTHGDVLILSNFTEAEARSAGAGLRVELTRRWSRMLQDSVRNFCSASRDGDDVCGEVNTSPFQPAWDTGPLGANQFLEVGVDLTNALDFGANSVPCFARFQAETRSSQETTATLKDFAGGQFNTCNSTTVTTPMAGQKLGLRRRASARARRSPIRRSSPGRRTSVRRRSRPEASRSSSAGRRRRRLRARPAAMRWAPP